MKTLKLVVGSALIFAAGAASVPLSKMTIEAFLGKESKDTKVSFASGVDTLKEQEPLKPKTPGIDPPDVLWKEGLQKEANNNLIGAKRCYELIVENYPDTEYAAKAAERNAELGPILARQLQERAAQLQQMRW